MRKDRILDMLDDADDRIVERLSVPALTEKEKERLLKMSTTKVERMSLENNMEEEVRGVDEYRRPKWHRFASVAAAIALVSGMVGTGVLLKRGGKKPEDDFHAVAPSAQVTDTTGAGSTEPMTTGLAGIVATDAITTEGILTTEAVDAASDYEAIAVDLMKAMNAVELASSGALTVDGNSPLASDGRYFKVTNGNVNGFDFSTVENVRGFLSGNFTGKFYEEHSLLTEGSDPLLKEGPDGLYAREAGRGNIYSWTKYEPEIISSSETSFVARAEYDIAGTSFQVDITVVKSDGVWRVDSVSDTSANTGNTDNTQTYPALCRNRVESKWNELTAESDTVSIDTVFNDLDGDGTPEFLMMYGNGEYNYQIDVYTYRDGDLKILDTLPGGHTSFAVDKNTGKLVLIRAHMGAGDISWYTMENDAIITTKTEQFEYQTWYDSDVAARTDIHCLSRGAFYTAGEAAVSYLRKECLLNDTDSATEMNGLDYSIIDQLYSEAVYVSRVN